MCRRKSNLLTEPLCIFSAAQWAPSESSDVEGPEEGGRLRGPLSWAGLTTSQAEVWP